VLEQDAHKRKNSIKLYVKFLNYIPPISLFSTTLAPDPIKLHNDFFSIIKTTIYFARVKPVQYLPKKTLWLSIELENDTSDQHPHF
jgi:hypothetical protein